MCLMSLCPWSDFKKLEIAGPRFLNALLTDIKECVQLSSFKSNNNKSNSKISKYVHINKLDLLTSSVFMTVLCTVIYIPMNRIRSEKEDYYC